MINYVNISQAISKARKILGNIGIEYAKEFGLQNILYARGIDLILTTKIVGSDARISMRGNRAIVSINETIKQESRINFILAHELAHYELHSDLISAIHLDDYNSFNSWFSGGHHEIEANYFASELLMPRTSFIKHCPQIGFSLDSIDKLATLFGSSLSSCSLQFCNYGNYPICVVHSENGIIKWSKSSEDFPLRYVEAGDPLSNNSVAGDLFYDNVMSNNPEEIEASAWFSKDHNYAELSDIELFEQCFTPSSNSITSIIWTK